MDFWTLTDRLRKTRELAGLDTAEMAAALGASRATVSRWENGHTTPRRSDLIAWGLVTGFRWQWLLSGDGVPQLNADTGRYPRRVAA